MNTKCFEFIFEDKSEIALEILKKIEVFLESNLLDSKFNFDKKVYIRFLDPKNRKIADTSGKTIKEVRFVAVYYRNNQVVGDDIKYCFENVNNNSTAYFTMDNDFDKSTFENIDYDKVEVYTICVQTY